MEHLLQTVVALVFWGTSLILLVIIFGCLLWPERKDAATEDRSGAK